jgi:hypothetical protein
MAFIQTDPIPLPIKAPEYRFLVDRGGAAEAVASIGG